jgi:hypothetical protein
MKYVLTLFIDPKTFGSLSEDEQNAVFTAHDRFQETTKASGEYVETKAFAQPEETVTVRVREGVASTTDGLYAGTGTGEFLCGHYVVDCETKERAIELAALVPEAALTGVEVRPVVHEQ